MLLVFAELSHDKSAIVHATICRLCILIAVDRSESQHIFNKLILEEEHLMSPSLEMAINRWETEGGAVGSPAESQEQISEELNAQTSLRPSVHVNNEAQSHQDEEVARATGLDRTVRPLCSLMEPTEAKGENR
jgi:hypothetical protein